MRFIVPAGRRTRSALASASTSLNAVTNRSCETASLQIGPIGSRAAPVIPANGREVDELFPERQPRVRDRFGDDVGLGEERIDQLHPIGHPRYVAGGFAEDDATMDAGLLDHARTCERRRDVGGAAEDAALADRGFNLPGAVDAVLQRQHHRVVAGDDLEQRQRGGVAVGLDGVDDEVDGTDGFGPVFGRSVDLEVAERALDEETSRTDRLEMSAPREERHIVAGARQLGAVESTDRAGSDNADSHDVGATLQRLEAVNIVAGCRIACKVIQRSHEHLRW